MGKSFALTVAFFMLVLMSYPYFADWKYLSSDMCTYFLQVHLCILPWMYKYEMFLCTYLWYAYLCVSLQILSYLAPI